ncbi:GTP 3',8-cyclase MoaA [Planctomicrobium sp. SH664]|uniref:GTP 3',8-cyclase MoaA n=1 Tax=Planctomicrobium sp. SH664 TaxID=3448125 RepID=UPI003F5B211C
MNSLPLIDSFQRTHTNLRISVTDRCNLRCVYCMPAEFSSFLPRQELLTYEEIERFVRIVAPLGVHKIRLTGGEPLVRRDLPELIARLVRIDGITDVGLTTNGILLAGQAEGLFAAGLRRLNISLDALQAEKFEEITRRTGFEQVRAGIDKAREVGFAPIKINAVSIRNFTESEIVPFGRLARETGCEVRFIEYMPLDADAAWERGKVLFASEIIQILARELLPLVPVGEQDPMNPATEYLFSDGTGRIGFIPSVSQPFCNACNRFRLTADGKLRSCLFSLEEFDVREQLRSDAGDHSIEQRVRECLAAKWAGHHINAVDFKQPQRPMHSIGG